jgi:CBS domain-containing protein
MKAGDLMKPAGEHLLPGDGVRDFVRKIGTARAGEGARFARVLPVLDTMGRPVGVISMFDVIRGMYPDYLFISDLHSFTWDGMMESLAKKVAEKKVSDLMAAPAVTVKKDHPLMECVDQMIKHRISTILVVDDEGKLLGMLYEDEIFFVITEAIRGGGQP